MAVPPVPCQPHLVSPAGLWRVPAALVSCRLEEIDGFFARNDEDCLALIFEKEGSYLGREVSCPQGPCNSRVAIRREPNEFMGRAVLVNSRVWASCAS